LADGDLRGVVRNDLIASTIRNENFPASRLAKTASIFTLSDNFRFWRRFAA
jgi:hypothetical protein